MNIRRRHTRKYTFKKPDLGDLRRLGSLVSSPEDFRHRYGKLLTILKTRIEEGILETLVQFYDPLHHCFTFPDYQLVPTLEEYAYWFGLPISDQVPFSGLERIPDVKEIAAALHMEEREIRTNLIVKGGILGLTSKFLMKKAFLLADAGSTIAFEIILALLIYGLLLFPNIDHFVDIKAIQIFITGNPVPTLIGDTYHSIHHRTQKGSGVITCCAPLLYKWFSSHLPRTNLFKDNPDKLRWSQRLMSLTQSDITWYNPECDSGVLIVSCGEFPNVPLFGTRGGINYNPVLARRQMGYPMEKIPKSLLLSSFFFINEEEGSDLKERMVRAWHRIRRIGKDQLGKKNCMASERYTQWIHARACALKMPYPLGNSSFPSPSASNIPIEKMEEYQEVLDRMRLERDTWEDKHHDAEFEKRILKRQLMETEDRLKKQKQVQEDLFSSCFQPAPSEDWKTIAERLEREKMLLKIYYEGKLIKLQGEGPSSDRVPQDT